MLIRLRSSDILQKKIVNISRNNLPSSDVILTQSNICADTAQVKVSCVDFHMLEYVRSFEINDRWSEINAMFIFNYYC